jgi:hypothetical protein
MGSQMMMNVVTSLANAGAEDILYNWETIYDLLLELTQNSGYDEPQRFWLNPRTPEGQQAIANLKKRMSQPSAEDIKTQTETQEIGERVELDKQKAAQDYETKMKELEVRNREAAVKEREVDLESQKVQLKQYELEVKHAATVAELQLEMEQGRAVKLGDRQTPNNPTDGDLEDL